MRVMSVSVRIVLFIVLIGVSFVACSDESVDSIDESLKDYKPMVYVSDILYEDSGEIVNVLPDGAFYVGKIMQVVPQNKTMDQENFTANVPIMDSEIYQVDNDSNTIYIKVSSGSREQYAVYTLLE